MTQSKRVVLLVSLIGALAMLVLGASARAHKFSKLYQGLQHRLLHNKKTHNEAMAILNDDTNELWFTQKLDHFDLSNNQTWSQRYFMNDTFWQKPDGPVFVMLGGEGPETAAGVAGHFIINEYAQKFGALILSVEHRFYGKSNPTPDLSTANLRYLSSKQALADFATFQQYISQKYGLTSANKWISFGGSYSGALSAWFRQQYPNIITASIAASAPVQAQLNFPEYNEVVSQSIGPQCAATLHSAYTQVNNILNNDKKKLEQLFSACSPINTDLDTANFLSNLEDGIANIVQYNEDNTNYTPMNINAMCERLTTDEPLQALINFNSYMNKLGQANCTQVSYADMVAELQDIRTYPANQGAAGRSWFYQTCTEFGYYQTGDATDQPFPSQVNLPFFLQQCKDAFNITISTASPDYTQTTTNTFYGGRALWLNGQSKGKVVFTNGSVDPWHMLSVRTQPVNNDVIAVYIPGTAHCADLYSPAATDVSELTMARAVQVTMLQKWLNE